MRQRYVRNLEERLKEHSVYLIDDPKKLKGKWKEYFKNDNDILIELGCGKGKFITTLASINKDKNYIAFEGQDTVIIRTLEKVKELNLTNVLVVNTFVNDLNDYFIKDEIKGIYLNFSDPWPKKRHAKRRLVYSKRILNYLEILKNGFISFKTDNTDLFNFGLSELEELNIDLDELTFDLQKSNYEIKDITTEYEDKFTKLGKNIMYFKIEVKNGIYRKKR